MRGYILALYYFETISGFLMDKDTKDARRAFLLRGLAAGLYSLSLPAAGQLLGRVPRQLPAGTSIYSLKGTLRVNGQEAKMDSRIAGNDTLKTDAGSQAIFVVGKDAFVLREKSELKLSGAASAVSALRLLTGGLLAVFGTGEHRLETQIATVGIRGTGIYMEAAPDLSYFCTCYGTADIASIAQPAQSETVVATHHDSPRYVSAAGKILPAPMINHTDEELMLIESLVGRTTPFPH